MASKSDSDWASLPENVLDSILGHLAPMDDCIRFSAVCSKWRRVACENFRDSLHHLINRRRRRHQLPLLMVPSPDNSTDTRSLYDVRRKRLYDFQLKVPYNRRCAGSSHGWLIFVEDSFEVTLFNPFSGKSIHLPPIRRLLFEKRMREEDENDEMSDLSHLEKYEYEKKLREEYDEEEEEYLPDTDEIEIYYDSEDEDEMEQHFEEEEVESSDPKYIPYRFDESIEYSVSRGVLSANPEINPNEYILMVIYGTWRRLAFIRPGDENWTYIDKNICDFLETTYQSLFQRGLWYWSDIIYRNGLFYVLDNLGVLLSCDVRTNLKVDRVTRLDSLYLQWDIYKTYLVQSSEGDLLFVIRVIEDKYHYGMTIKFVVYKLVDFWGDSEWMEVNSLGNDALFLGDNHSISVIASDFVGCQSNSIYFSDDCDDFYNRGGPNDIGVYNFQDGCVRRHYTPAHSQRLMSPSIWILPTFLSRQEVQQEPL